MPPKKSKRPTKPKTTKAKAKAKKTTALDWAIGGGIKTKTPRERATAASKAKTHPAHAKTQKVVLAIFRQCYPGDDTEAQILATDPNEYDMDPSMFYEVVEARTGVPQDPKNEYFGGYGGPIRDLVAFLTPRWDGKLREE
jgi:hypothetical protein